MNDTLYYQSGSTPAGEVLVVWSSRGVRALRLLERLTLTEELADLRRCYCGVELEENAREGKKLLRQIRSVLEGEESADAIALDMQGTAFQKLVWQELLRVPRGQTISYQALAARVGKPKAIRAVASACARNPVGLIVPCHRIVRSDGGLGGYYYGLVRKRALLDLEGAPA